MCGYGDAHTHQEIQTHQEIHTHQEIQTHQEINEGGDGMTRENRRPAIVRAAFRLIANAGFEGFRVRTVAEHAGIHHATLLHYFPTKEALVEAVVENMLEELRQEGYRHGALSTMDTLCQEFLDMRERFLDQPEFLAVLNELHLRAQRDPLIAALLERMDRSWRHYLTSLLERGVASGEFRSDLAVGAVVDVLILQFRGFGSQVQRLRDQHSIDGLIAAECAMLRHWLMST